MSREEIDHYAIMAVARWLREWRERTGTSQRRVAELAGIDQGGLSRVERGLEGRPSGWRLARILVVLDWLSGGGDPASPWERPSQLRPEQLPPDARPRPPAIVGPRHRPQWSRLTADDPQAALAALLGDDASVITERDVLPAAERESAREG